MKKTRKNNGGWTTAEYIIGLAALAVIVTGIVQALGIKLEGLVKTLPF